MRRAITFVHSPLVDFGQNYGARFAPLWAFTLAAYVPATFEARVSDCTSEPPRELGYADVFAFSGINQDLETLLAVRNQLKARHPRALFILGGPITWSFEQEERLGLLDAFDYLFVLDAEHTLPRFLEALERGTLGELPRVQRGERFQLADARPLDFDLYRRLAARNGYSGAALEVSRGCPFLCEFCDVRSIPGNNRSNNKPAGLVVDELDRYWALGITQFVFACDNFIGDPAWARECADAIVAWRERTGARPAIFTWLTLNVAKQPELMKQLRRAGFSVLFIGVESVNPNALLETAKLQNRGDLRGALARIHGHGFVVAPGLIFGFDSDKSSVFDDTLALIAETGLIGGDPSFLSALPGTPLFARMKRTGRLLEHDDRASARRKISTNLRYLQDSRALSQGFTRFIARLTSAGYQLARFRRHLELISASSEFVESPGVGLGSAWQYLRLQWGQAESRAMLLLRVRYLLLEPAHLSALLRGFWLWRRAEKARPGLGVHFYFWVYFWTNLALKYRDLSSADFDLHSTAPSMSIAEVARDAAAALISGERLSNPRSKASKQALYTSAALDRLAAAAAASVGVGVGVAAGHASDD
jgi:radical SAM superfamily enzyme YgiQ (UPF0313 family)